jgi:hypothetical protein
VASNSEQNRLRLQETLELRNMNVVLAISLSENSLRAIQRDTVDVLLVDVDDEMGNDLYHINDVLEQLDIPLVYHDGSNTLANGELDDNISRQLLSLMPAANTA